MDIILAAWRLGFRFCLASSLILGCAITTWAQRNLKDIPDPDPEIERKSFIVADGFEVNLYASDPLIANRSR
jgi:hypothetical protein